MAKNKKRSLLGLVFYMIDSFFEIINYIFQLMVNTGKATPEIIDEAFKRVIDKFPVITNFEKKVKKKRVRKNSSDAFCIFILAFLVGLATITTGSVYRFNGTHINSLNESFACGKMSGGKGLYKCGPYSLLPPPSGLPLWKESFSRNCQGKYAKCGNPNDSLIITGQTTRFHHKKETPATTMVDISKAVGHYHMVICPLFYKVVGWPAGTACALSYVKGTYGLDEEKFAQILVERLNERDRNNSAEWKRYYQEKIDEVFSDLLPDILPYALFAKGLIVGTLLVLSFIKLGNVMTVILILAYLVFGASACLDPAKTEVLYTANLAQVTATIKGCMRLTDLKHNVDIHYRGFKPILGAQKYQIYHDVHYLGTYTQENFEKYVCPITTSEGTALAESNSYGAIDNGHGYYFADTKHPQPTGQYSICKKYTRGGYDTSGFTAVWGTYKGCTCIWFRTQDLNKARVFPVYTSSGITVSLTLTTSAGNIDLDIINGASTTVNVPGAGDFTIEVHSTFQPIANSLYIHKLPTFTHNGWGTGVGYSDEYIAIAEADLLKLPVPITANGKDWVNIPAWIQWGEAGERGFSYTLAETIPDYVTEYIGQPVKGFHIDQFTHSNSSDGLFAIGSVFIRVTTTIQPKSEDLCPTTYVSYNQSTTNAGVFVDVVVKKTKQDCHGTCPLLEGASSPVGESASEQITCRYHTLVGGTMKLQTQPPVDIKANTFSKLTFMYDWVSSTNIKDINAAGAKNLASRIYDFTHFLVGASHSTYYISMSMITLVCYTIKPIYALPTGAMLVFSALPAIEGRNYGCMVNTEHWDLTCGIANHVEWSETRVTLGYFSLAKLPLTVDAPEQSQLVVPNSWEWNYFRDRITNGTYSNKEVCVMDISWGEEFGSNKSYPSNCDIFLTPESSHYQCPACRIFIAYIREEMSASVNKPYKMVLEAGPEMMSLGEFIGCRNTPKISSLERTFDGIIIKVHANVTVSRCPVKRNVEDAAYYKTMSQIRYSGPNYNRGHIVPRSMGGKYGRNIWPMTHEQNGHTKEMELEATMRSTRQTITFSRTIIPHCNKTASYCLRYNCQFKEIICFLLGNRTDCKCENDETMKDKVIRVKDDLASYVTETDKSCVDTRIIGTIPSFVTKVTSDDFSAEKYSFLLTQDQCEHFLVQGTAGEA